MWGIIKDHIYIRWSKYLQDLLIYNKYTDLSLINFYFHLFYF